MSKYFLNKQKDTLLMKPINNLSDWQFDDKVAEVFHDMIKRSVPGYENITTTIGMLASRFLKDNSIIYDLGCSIGTTALSIRRNIKAKNCKIIAIDKSSAMIDRCQEHMSTYRGDTPIEIIESDILDINIQNASMVVLNFTLQFIKPDKRQKLINHIYEGLNLGGLLILSEKFNFNDEKIKSLLFSMHYDFKRANGYTELEISQKSNMLKNTLLPDSIDIHKARLQTAGFNHCGLLFQYFNFGSLIAIKS